MKTGSNDFRPWLTSVGRLRSHAGLGAILLFGLALRILWMLTQVAVISSDGSVYAAMAEHLRHQHALIGTGEGPQILYAPLYSLLIAATMMVTPSSEAAGHVVSLLSGTALIGILFFVSQYLYGRRTAFVAAVLGAVHPLLIALSASVYNEALYLTVWMAMGYWALRALDLHRPLDALILGTCVGLAYLTRVEAMAYLPLLAAAVWIEGLLRRNVRVGTVYVAIMCVGFLALASPYVIYLYRHTGHVRFEAKWNINYTMARNRLSGMNPMEAALGIRPDLTVEGPLLEMSKFVDFTPYSRTFADQLNTVASMIKLNAHTVYHYLVERQFGSPIVWVLLIVGWCRKPWTTTRLKNEVILSGLAVSIVTTALASPTAEVRYLFALGPVLVLWSANGLHELGQWLLGFELMTNRRVLRPGAIAATVQLGAAAVMVAAAGGGVKDDGYFASEHTAEALAARDAGIWLAQQRSNSKRIAVRLPVVTYYAKAASIAFPYAGPDATLRYLAKQNVDFIVLESAEAPVIPTIGEWIAHGIPDPRAQLVYDRTTAPGVRVVIYEWRHT
jgi:Dolichyl-phosphate-mannose-protein mannosyltransferase